MFDDRDKATVLISAVIHIVGHTGKSNRFLSMTDHPHALNYNDINVSQMHAVSAALEVTMSVSSINIFKNLDPKEFRALKKDIVDSVLATNLVHNSKCNDVISFLKRVDIDKVVIRRVLMKSACVNFISRSLSSNRRWSLR